MCIAMTLFAHRFLVSAGPEPSMPLGRYDEGLSLWINAAGLPIAETLHALPTRADRDRPDALGTITKADRDRDDMAAHLVTKPAGERDLLAA